MVFLCFIMQDKHKWLEYADKAIKLVPLYLPALFKVLPSLSTLSPPPPHNTFVQVVETKTMVALIYLDWLCRSPLALELYGTKNKIARTARPIWSPEGRERKKIEENLDIESEQNLPRDEQIKLLRNRVSAITACNAELTRLGSVGKENFLHKSLLVRAEMARVAIALGSDAIFCVEGQIASKQDSDEAMELYESAIEEAHESG
jgi:hypothetical protein